MEVSVTDPDRPKQGMFRLGKYPEFSSQEQTEGKERGRLLTPAQRDRGPCRGSVVTQKPLKTPSTNSLPTYSLSSYSGPSMTPGAKNVCQRKSLTSFLVCFSEKNKQ